MTIISGWSSGSGIHTTWWPRIFTTLVQTLKKLGRSDYAYLRDRLSGGLPHPPLAHSILQAADSG